MQTTFLERASEVLQCSGIAVQVFLSDDNRCLRMRQMKPTIASDIDPETIEAQQLRSVGVVGLHGLTPMCAFEEDLHEAVIVGIATAFKTYLKTLLGDDFAERQEACEIAELERMFQLADPRLN